MDSNTLDNYKNNFVHLHVHTQYSLLDGAAHIDKLCQSAKQKGFQSLAITDHGNMYGVIEFYLKCKENSIKPIIGCEVYTAPRTRFDKVQAYDAHYGHLVLLCENFEGYKNLMKLVSSAQLEGMYYKPRVDMELLKKHHSGLIALSACLRGDVPQAYLTKGYEYAKAKALELEQIFGKGNFYLEIQNHGIEEEEKVIGALVNISEETGIELVATNDVHYVEKSDAFLQDILTCIQTNKKVTDTDRLKFEGEEFYLKSYDEMYTLFAKYKNAMENSCKIAKRCNVEIDFNKRHVPKIELDTDTPHGEYLKNLCYEGLSQKYKTVTQDLKDRLNYELDVIQKMGFEDYFLIVYDFVKFAKSHNIAVGPGRGSAAGSIAAYTLDITEIDPIKYGLIFERFLNPERISMPDIDIDFCYERRDEVKDYVTAKYGEDKVAQIVTFGTLAAKAAVRSVGKALGLAASVVDMTAKTIPEVIHIKLKDAVDTIPELKKLYNTNPDVKRLIDVAMQLEGFPKNTSTHAAGVIIADAPLTEYTPLQMAETGVISQYSMGALEMLGLLKMDFLALRNLTVIRDTVNIIKATRNIDVDIKNIPYDDKETFLMIDDGDTDGVFQLENPGLQTFLRKFRPKCLEDIIITTSIYRPGPMAQIPDFLKNVKNPDAITYIHPLLKKITAPTYGAIVYQEQVMEIVRVMGGYSMARADMVRKVMSKKKPELMAKERQTFVSGAMSNGIDENKANEVFDYLASFAQYAFNKSHAACYATVAYQTAYLKCHYPSEYLTALLISLIGNVSKTNKYLKSFSKFGINLLKPDVNYSTANFSVENGNIRFGLGALKNVGMKFPADIEAQRRNGKFKSVGDFINRMAKYDVNRRSYDVLIKSGALDSLLDNRRAIMLAAEQMLEFAISENKLLMGGQQSFFDNEAENSMSIENIIDLTEKDFTLQQKLAYEKEFAGMYFSGHPLKEYAHLSKAYSNTEIYDITESEIPDRQSVNICGVLSQVSKKHLKSGKVMCTCMLSDFFGEIELVAFENNYIKYANALTEAKCIFVSATVNRQAERPVSLMLNSALELDSLSIADNKSLYVRLTDNGMLEELLKITRKYRGKFSLCLYFEDKGNLVRSTDENNVEICAQLVNELCDKFGYDNVKIK